MMNKIFTNEFITELILQIVFIMIFINVFYYTYIVYAEVDIIKSQARLIANSFNDYIAFLPKSLLDRLSIYKDTIDSSLTESNIKNNNNLKHKSLIIVSTFALIGFILCYLIYKNNLSKLYNIITIVLISVIFVGITEYVFFNIVIRKHISVEPNYIKFVLFNKIKNNISN